MSDQPQTTTGEPIKLYKMRVHYHVSEVCDYEVYAPDLNCAHAIAATRFDKEHTDKCVRDSVTQHKPLLDPNRHQCTEKKSWMKT